MGALELSGIALTGISKALELISRAIELSRQGDEDAALKLLDEALDRSDNATAAVRPALVGVKKDIAAQIAAKRKEFDTSDVPTVSGPAPEIIR